MTSIPRRLQAALVLLVCSFALLFWHTITGLVHDWATDDNYSHGFLIVPLAAYLVWERRVRLQSLRPRPTYWGLAIVGGSVAVLIAGLLGAELFLPRVAIIGTLVGGTLFVLGWPHLRILLFPAAILLLMIPIPAIIYNQIVFPLQLVASRVGESSLGAAGIPVLREGNILILANTSLEVAEACSGIRSLISLLTLSIFYAYFTDPRAAVRTIVALSTVPVAILANGLRVAGTGIAAHYYGPAAAAGFFHTFAGWLVFVFAFLLLFVIMRLLLWLWPQNRTDLRRAVPRLIEETE